jgi:hypothetical protein
MGVVAGLLIVFYMASVGTPTVVANVKNTAQKYKPRSKPKFPTKGPSAFEKRMEKEDRELAAAEKKQVQRILREQPGFIPSGKDPMVKYKDTFEKAAKRGGKSKGRHKGKPRRNKR